MESSSFESTREFYDAWLKTYEATFGRLVEMPAMGPAREKYKNIMKGFSNYANFFAISMDFNSDFQKVFMEAMLKVHEKLAYDKKDEIGLEKYRDFYSIWIETCSSTFKEFMQSDHFAADVGNYVSNTIEFQKYIREMLEENYLKQMNFATRTEIDEINKELYSLRKQLKDLTNQINDLTVK